MRNKLILFRGDRTQAEMGRLYGVSQQAWATWESGGVVPRGQIMFKISQDAGIPIEDLFFDDGDKLKLSDGAV